MCETEFTETHGEIPQITCSLCNESNNTNIISKQSQSIESLIELFNLMHQKSTDTHEYTRSCHRSKKKDTGSLRIMYASFIFKKSRYRISFISILGNYCKSAKIWCGN